MKYIIISFKNRNDVMSFKNILANNNISTSIINTPRSIAISCGLSIKTDVKNMNYAISLLHATNVSGFIGIFLYQRINGYEQIRKLY